MSARDYTLHTLHSADGRMWEFYVHANRVGVKVLWSPPSVNGRIKYVHRVVVIDELLQVMTQDEAQAMIAAKRLFRRDYLPWVRYSLEPDMTTRTHRILTEITFYEEDGYAIYLDTEDARRMWRHLAELTPRI